MQNFRSLLVRQKSHRLAVSVHNMTASWQRRGNSGLLGQIRSAAQSIPANIAEGAGRDGDKEFARFVRIAIGSSTELEYHLEYARGIKLMNPKHFEAYQDRTVEVRKMLIGLLKKLR